MSPSSFTNNNFRPPGSYTIDPADKKKKTEPVPSQERALPGPAPGSFTRHPVKGGRVGFGR